jgi:ComF family protein
VPVCDACLDSIRALDEPVCSVCGQHLLGAQLANTRCPECEQIEQPFERAAAYGSYSGALRDLIHLLKYARVRPAAGVLGRMLAEVIEAFVPQFGLEPPVVIAVPLHASKLRQRGFNQSELIARSAIKNLHTTQLSINNSALMRRRPTESQTGLSRAQRRLNIKGAFEVAHPKEIVGRDIIVVDDVCTTGTTVSECARVLRRARAGRIWVATVARVLKPEATYALPVDMPDEERVTRRAAAAAHA